MTHVREHCEPPTARRRDAGRLWACTCGKVWVVRYGVEPYISAAAGLGAWWELLFTAKPDS